MGEILTNLGFIVKVFPMIKRIKAPLLVMFMVYVRVHIENNLVTKPGCVYLNTLSLYST